MERRLERIMEHAIEAELIISRSVRVIPLTQTKAEELARAQFHQRKIYDLATELKRMERRRDADNKDQT